ncbi:glutamate 5-kinase [Herbinix hemicellulosilytica]|uniref:Glutamate 5-kinase n=1 Tax=Herbinix hemicellulosilytica TaxID=1564487 RepID=A0A0H5SGV3_HERHM|nr:glutamate 5-kinase [Herbinix hemicellulosilytica]RBP60593.1 glutamate 5-kinase [Herbinix hemicellulosilytica]CRZ34280.1 Glutamate 5-kinase [Herbinix hemicellulosilytica]
MQERKDLINKKRIVVKIGSSSLTHMETGNLNLDKMERLVRILTNLRNQGKDVILVTSGAIAVGRNALGLTERPKERTIKQACAAVGQARLMMVYQKLFAEYNQIAAQILITKHTMLNDISRTNAQNTFNELLKMGVIPIVNENDTVSTDEMDFGDNDTLSAVVTALVGGDLLILLSDIDGFYTDDPHVNKDATLISCVKEIDDELMKMAKSSTGCNLGTGGMASKISAAKIANASGADMVIVNGDDVQNINRVIDGKEVGTLFLAHKADNFNIMDYLRTKQYNS